MLGHLVAPLWWLATLTLGFVYKTDEPLVGDAITRLVSHQPALATAAVGLTVVWMTSQPRARIAGRTRAAAYVGAPVAYLLTISLAAGEGWVDTWPLLVAGAASFLSIELLMRDAGKTQKLIPLRPFLVAALIAPLLPGLDTPWAGVLVLAVYMALFEWTARTASSDTTPLTLSRAGIGLGAAMTLGTGWPALVAFMLITVWAHYRRLRPVDDDPDLVHTLAAAIAPVGVGYALTEVVPGTGSWAVMATTLLAIGVLSRAIARHDEFWEWWSPGAAILVLAGVLDSATSAPDPWRVAALIGVAGTFAVGSRWPTGRLWAAATVITIAVGESARYLPDPVNGWAFVFAGLGLAMVTAAAFRPRSYSGHLAAIGHLLAALSLLTPDTDVVLAAVVGAWTVGWFLTTLVSETGAESVTSLLARVLGEPGRRLAEMTPPLITAASIPVAVVLALRLSPAYAANGSWVGVTFAVLAVGYALAARTLTESRLLHRVTGVGAFVLVLLAPVLATPERIPLIASFAAGVAVAVIMARSPESRLLAGYGWVAGFGMVILLVEKAGVPTEHLDAVALVLGIAGVVSSLLFDDYQSGRREPGQGLRATWIRRPMAVGTVAATVGLITLLFELPDSGWWVVGAGIAVVGIAYLARTGLLSALGYLLAIAGVFALDIDYWLEEQWRAAIVAAPLVTVAIATRRRQPESVASNDMLRWDLPAVMVAHLVSGIALLSAFAHGDVVLTALAFGVLALALGAAYRNRVWLETGNGLFLLAAFDAGTGWLALILGITSVRGAVSAYYKEGTARRAHHLLGAISGAVGWLVFLSWLELTLSEAIDLSAFLASGFTLLVVVAGRRELAKPDSVRIWGSAGVAIVAWAIWGSVVAAGVDGPALAIGLTVIAAAMELSHQQTSRGFRFVAAPTTGLAWIFFAVGSEWSSEMTTGLSAVVFGVVALVVAELAQRIQNEEGSHVAMAWGALAFVAVAAATVSSWVLGDDYAGYLTATGVALLGLGAARAATPLAWSWLRAAATVLWLTSLVILAWTADWPAENLAVVTALVGALSTFAYLVLWVRGRAENWKGPLNALAVIGNLLAGTLALYVWPARGLTVAITLSLAAQAMAVGLYRDKPALLALAPPLTASAFFIALGEGFARNPLWYTLPVGIVALSELEILRHVRRHAGEQADNAGTLTVEVLGLGLLVMPSLVSMFGGGLAYAGVGLAVAVICLVWAGVTRVKRRVIAAGAIALATTVLSVVAGAAGSAPETVAFWVTGAGIGVAVMMVAGFIEAYRSKKGQLMVRLDRLMEGWE
jgi:hypothetical protein